MLWRWRKQKPLVPESNLTTIPWSSFARSSHYTDFSSFKWRTQILREFSNEVLKKISGSRKIDARHLGSSGKNRILQDYDIEIQGSTICCTRTRSNEEGRRKLLGLLEPPLHHHHHHPHHLEDWQRVRGISLERNSGKEPMSMQGRRNRLRILVLVMLNLRVPIPQCCCGI